MATGRGRANLRAGGPHAHAPVPAPRFAAPRFAAPHVGAVGRCAARAGAGRPRCRLHEALQGRLGAGQRRGLLPDRD
ncbi:MAG: hypothetical protein ACK559_40420, partial [bacterium]